MHLRHLRYLIAVAEHGNFTRAAEALHVSQPTLSQQIQQIEARLGVALLDRSGRTVRMTDAGQAYIAHARRALRELEAGHRAIGDLQDLSRGHVRVAMTPTFTAYLIGPLVAAFQARHPGIDLQLREMTMDTIAAAVAADEVDLGIAFALPPDAELESHPLFAESLNIVVGERHPWAKRGAVRAAELADTRFGLLSPEFITRVHVEAYLRRVEVAPRVSVEVNTIGALLEIVRAGTLTTILPAPVAAVAGLVNLAVDPPVPSRTAALLQRRDACHSAAAKAFASLLREHVSE